MLGLRSSDDWYYAIVLDRRRETDDLLLSTLTIQRNAWSIIFKARVRDFHEMRE